MSKVDKILDDELDPEDLDPTPRGGKNGRDKPEPKAPPRRFAAVLAAAFAVLAACNGINGTPSPRPKYPEDDPEPGYTCSYDGNGKCPTPPPDVRATCDEPASWCHSTTNLKETR